MPSADIHIQATDTDPVLRAQDAIRTTQQQLLEQLTTPRDPQTGAAAVRDHLRATDEALYAPAAGAARTSLLVRALRTTAAALMREVSAQAPPPQPNAATPPGALHTALTAHFAVEREVLLPALAELPGADLTAYLQDLHTLLAGGRLEQPDVIDVTEMPRPQRHPRIFARYARLADGETFTLVNNHDPKPLRREFETAYPDAFSWEYVESGPERWQVRIGRVSPDA